MRYDLLKDAYDLHVHTNPDVVTRRVDHLEAAERVIAAGMKGFTIKSHYSLTTDRAEETVRLYPECDAVGAIVLNTTVGGINPAAAEYAINCGARIVWFPTMDSPAEQGFIIEHAPDLVAIQLRQMEKGIKIPDCSILDSNGKLLQSAKDVIDVCAHYDVAVATGHMSHAETFALADYVKDSGLKKFVITHVNLPATRYSIDEQKALVQKGAVIERAYICVYNGMSEITREAEEISAVGSENVILVSDFGRPEVPFFDEGMAQYAELLINEGLSEQDIRKMVAVNTARLVEKQTGNRK